MAARKGKIFGKNRLSYFHVMSRTVNGEALFGNREKEIFRKMLWKVAEFSGVRVITYAVMKNHFHILVEVPPQGTEVSDAELVRRYRLLYPQPTPWQPMRAEILERRLKENLLEGKELREWLLHRMHDISEFMRTLKLRFTRWFNRSRERFGPLWSARFKSVLVEGDCFALRTVAAYIDLNAVRAGLVKDPKDYRFCGYAEALAGSRLARAGLSVVGKDLEGYRQTLYGSGAGEQPGKISIPREEALRVLEREKGQVALGVILRCRVRYFSDGMVLGSAEFVREFLHREAPDKMGKRPHLMRGANWNGLSVG
ncbi:MAG: transposase, partial [Puniceicoccales bacterium]